MEVSRNLKGIIGVALMVLPVHQSFASGDVLLGGEGNDRCGVGSMIFGSKKSISSQTSEDSTNRASSESVSVTTGTSGCSNSGFAANPKEAYYAHANFEELLIEMPQGRGEVLAGFAQTLGCGNGAVPRFMKMTQDKYSEISSDSAINPNQMLNSVKVQIKADPELAQSCQSFTI